MFKSVPLPEESAIAATILERLKKNPQINLYRLLALVPECFHPWLDFVEGVYKLPLDARLREIAFNRQGHKAKASYELFQHGEIAKKNGVTDKELKAILEEDIVTSLDPEANLICKVADEIESQATLSEATFQELFKRYDVKTALAFITAISFYSCVARFLNATRTPIEKENSFAHLTGKPF